MRLLYSAILYLSLPIILARLLWRAVKAPNYARRWSERFGLTPQLNHGDFLIWVHAVSVGETVAATPLIRSLLARHPGKKILLTTTTPTGSDQVKSSFAGEIAANRIQHCYAPYDLPDCVGRFLKRVTPKILIVMETEIWPNIIAACHKNQIPVILANGRLSEKSAHGYKKIHWLIAPALQKLSVAVMQHRDDAERLQALGMPAENCVVSGNIKFDLSIDQATRDSAQALRAEIDSQRQRKVWIAASTHNGEDEAIVDAFIEANKSCGDMLLILVPRHPERFEAVVELCLQAGLQVRRRSAKTTTAANVAVIVGDTMGELRMLYGVADIAFVGGSLIEVGGHNLMEPAAWGLPILTGPHLFNFAEAARLLQQAAAMHVVRSVEEMSRQVVDLLENPQQRKVMGEQARAVVENNRGALDKLLEVINSRVPDSPE